MRVGPTMVRKMARTAAVACATLFLAGSAFAQKVTTDYDRSADFTKYKTYSWAPSSSPAKDPLWHRRVMNDIDQQLAAKGLRRVDAGADLYVSYGGGLKENVSLQGFGSGGRWMGGSFSVSRTTEIEGTLIVEMVDSDSKELVWRGMATETASQKTEKNIEKLEKAVEKMFRQYPPKPEGSR